VRSLFFLFLFFFLYFIFTYDTWFWKNLWDTNFAFFLSFLSSSLFAVGYCSSGLLGVKLSTEGSENAN